MRDVAAHHAFHAATSGRCPARQASPSAPPSSPAGPSVADVLSHYRQPFLDHFGGTLSSPQSRALDAIPRCRTAELGGHSWECHTCGGRHGSFNSCHNRNCATCSRARRGEWFARQCDYVLPVKYFHVVFTVPHQLNLLIEANPRVIYKLQFDATAHALNQQAADSKHNSLGGLQLGFTTVLHSWGQALLTHLHSHVVIPGGGFSLSTRRQEWVSSPGREFLLESGALADVYRDYYLSQLRRLHRDGALVFPGDVGHLADAANYQRFLQGLEQFRWVIHCGSPEHCHRPEAALDYLARYVVGASISDTRVLSDQDGTVTLRMKDYRDAGAWKKIRMPGEEFVRRFLLHVLPPNMARVRYCGFLGNPVREQSLARAREQLGVDRRATSAAVPELPAGDKNDPDGDGGGGGGGGDGGGGDGGGGDGGGGDGGGGDGGGEPFDADTPRACPHCGSRSLQWVASFPGTYGWHARVSLVPRAAKERLIRERQAALAGITSLPPSHHVPAPPKVPP